MKGPLKLSVPVANQGVQVLSGAPPHAPGQSSSAPVARTGAKLNSHYVIICICEEALAELLWDSNRNYARLVE